MEKNYANAALFAAANIVRGNDKQQCFNICIFLHSPAAADKHSADRVTGRLILISGKVDSCTPVLCSMGGGQVEGSSRLDVVR